MFVVTPSGLLAAVINSARREWNHRNTPWLIALRLPCIKPSSSWRHDWRNARLILLAHDSCGTMEPALIICYTYALIILIENYVHDKRIIGKEIESLRKKRISSKFVAEVARLSLRFRRKQERVRTEKWHFTAKKMNSDKWYFLIVVFKFILRYKF